MMNRRELAPATLLAMAALIAPAGAARADATTSLADAQAALDAWADALFTGDPAVVETVLAPEYQIVRSDGTGYGKADYLTTLPKQTMRSKFSGIVPTGHDDLLVIRYVIETEQTIEGQQVEAVSPRLSVFRREGDRWLIVAHANFAKLG